MNQAASQAPRLRRYLSLRWKAFFTILAVLGVAFVAFGYRNYAVLVERSERLAAQRIADLDADLEQMWDESAAALNLVAAQLAGNAPEPSPEVTRIEELSSEVAASLAQISYFDERGRLFAQWLAEARPALGEAEAAAAVARVIGEHRPVSVLACTEDCVQFSFVPVLDRQGREIVVGAGRNVAEQLLSFARFQGADVALLLRGGPEHNPLAQPLLLWNRRVIAATQAPKLAPMLQALGAAVVAPPPPDQRGEFAWQGREFVYMRQPPRTVANGNELDTLLVLDQTEARAATRDDVLANLLFTLSALGLASLAVFLLVRSAMRRLTAVTGALPLLAEQRFDQAHRALGAERRSGGVHDEIDALRAQAAQVAGRLERLNAAEAASAAKSSFLAAMSHEIRTPLNGILGLLELHEQSELSPEQLERVRVIRDSATTLMTVIDDILDFSKIEAGRIEIEQAPLSVRDLVEGAVQTAVFGALLKGLRFVVFVDPDLPETAIGDAVRVRQVLFNLCNNAIKFTEQGQITVRADRVGNPRSGTRVRFAVRDTGIGIAPAAQALLFRAFQQAESSTTRRFGGSGLGLSICKGLVERMGGTIGMTSVEGQGSEFWFELGLGAAPAPAARPWPGDLLQGIGARVELPATDEAGFIRRYLESAGAGGPDLLLVREDDSKAGLLLRRLDAPSTPARAVHRPVRTLALLHEIAVLFGCEQRVRLPITPAAHRPAEAPPAPDVAERSARLVLVAEDHPTNKLVITAQLRRLGYAAEVASNGADALALAGRRRYALLLTDLHMPEMDGFELAASIRRREEQEPSRPRLPIIALTANAMHGESDRCRAAGMDGYLSKPVTLQELDDCLRKWIRVQHQPEPEPVDWAGLRDLLGDDDALLADVVEDFCRVNDALLERLTAAAAAADGAALHSLAHRLKGSARTLCAAELSRAAADLEALAPGGGQEHLSAAAARVEAAYATLRKHLRQRMPAKG